MTKKTLCALLALLILTLAAAGCSVKTGEGKLGVAPEVTGDVKRDFVNAFFTSNLNGRYTYMRAALTQAVSVYSPTDAASSSGVSEADMAYYDYYASIAPYATDKCIIALVKNTHMNVAVDQYAVGKKLWLVPREAKFTEKENTQDDSTLYDITIVCEAYEDETKKYLYDVTYKGELNTVTVDGVEKVDRIYTTERVEGK